MWKTAFPWIFLKAVFHKIYLVHSWMLCSIISTFQASVLSILTNQKKRSNFTASPHNSLTDFWWLFITWNLQIQRYLDWKFYYRIGVKANHMKSIIGARESESCFSLSILHDFQTSPFIYQCLFVSHDQLLLSRSSNLQTLFARNMKG